MKRLFADYRFSDEEMEKLFRDEYVTITFTAKSGNEMTVTGKFEFTNISRTFERALYA